MKTRRNKFSKRKTRRKRNKSLKGGKMKGSSKVNCSPKPPNEINNFSCYTAKSLVKLKEKWNARHGDDKITATDPREIHSELGAKMKTVCENELCWLKHVAKDVDLEESFAPEAPDDWDKNPNEWLSSTDINKVMQQYEKAYKCFEFIGPSPIDFDKREHRGECVWDELCNFSLEKVLKRGKTKVGMIFNTDTHDKPGQHWISMFINLKTHRIFFFDSTGDPPPDEVETLIQRIVQQGTELSPAIDFETDYNKTVHQTGDTECGVYSLFFIVQMLKDATTEKYLKTHRLKDSYIQKFRRVYFN